MKRVALFASLGLLLAACAGGTPSAKFDPSEAEIIRRPGTGSISGQASLTMAGGEVRYAAGNQVLLVPVTAYFRETITQYGTSRCSAERFRLKNPDVRAVQYIRSTRADGEGRFRFDRLAGGDYYVGTYVKLASVPTSGGAAAPQGCLLYEQVTVSDGQESKVILSEIRP
jgi:hypothetical protein